MYKYYRIIDSKETIILNNPSIDHYQHIYLNYDISMEFLLRYKDLFNKLKEVFNTFSLLSEESIINCLKDRMDIWDIYDYMHDMKYMHIHRESDDFEGKYIYTDDFYRINNPTNHEYEYYLEDMLKIINILIELYPDVIDYKSIYKDIKKVLIELNNKNKILIKDENIVFELPNAWYITNDGILYNSMGSDGHKESNLIYRLNDIKNCREGLNSFKSSIDYYTEIYNDIKEKGYITRIQYMHYLNWYGQPSFIYNDRIYHKIIVDLVLGIIKAHIELYKSFSELNHVDNYNQELEKIFELTNNQIDDLFVRFIHMSKVKSGGMSFICTTNTNEYAFTEYTDKGYRIDLVDPIEIVDGEVQVNNLDYHRKIRSLHN